MAIPAQVQNLNAEQADGNILLTWTGVLGATSYQVQRSTDGVNFTNLAAPTVNKYLDSLPGNAIMYWYQVAAINGSGTGPYSTIAQMVAANPGEMSLYELRLRSQETADRVGSQFVTTPEWNSFLRLGCYELYDLLIDSYEDIFSDQQVFIQTNGTTQYYPVPNGTSNYLGGNYNGVTGTPAPKLYKLVGMDLNVDTSNITQAWVTLRKFNFIDRNRFVYPNSTSTIYGVYNMGYRWMGNQINFIPVPAGNQVVRAWYAPILPALLSDSDVTTIGFSGWLRYVIARAAKYALDKEEGTETQNLTEELGFLKARIESAAQNKDLGSPDRISETRSDPLMSGLGWGGGQQAGFMIALFPIAMAHYSGNHHLAHAVLSTQGLLGYAAFGILFAYFLYFRRREFCRAIRFPKMFGLHCVGMIVASFSHFVSHIVGVRAQE